MNLLNVVAETILRSLSRLHDSLSLEGIAKKGIRVQDDIVFIVSIFGKCFFVCCFGGGG